MRIGINTDCVIIAIYIITIHSIQEITKTLSKSVTQDNKMESGTT